jgi:hypothetical protein
MKNPLYWIAKHKTDKVRNADWREFVYKKISLVLLIILIFIIAILLIPEKSMYSTYLSAIIDKHQILKTKKSPKIVFVGGSNIAFGLDTSMIEKRVGLSAFNMGLNAGLGLRFMLDEVKPYIKSGDVIVVIPEYQQFLGNTLNGESGGELLSVINVFPESIMYIKSPMQYLSLSKALPEFIRSKSIMFLKEKIGGIQKSEIYFRKAFNENGDVISHLGKKSADVGVDISKLELFEKKSAFNYDSIKILNEYNNYITNIGAKVLLTFPCIPQIHYNQNKEYIESIHNCLKDNLKLQIIGTPMDYVFPVSDFFNTVYHLNTMGREIRTIKLANDLNKALGFSRN